MTTKVHAIYKNGVFLPADPVALAEGTQVELTVTSSDDSGSIAGVLEEIARLPPEHAPDGFSGADHDKILYQERAKK